MERIEFMSSFKEAGKFKQPSMRFDIGVQGHGGVVDIGGNWKFQAKSPLFRLRPIDDDGISRLELSVGDLSPIKLRTKDYDGRNDRNEPSLMGAELEYTVVDKETGFPVSLYGNNRVEVGDEERAVVGDPSVPWLLDKMGADPEALAYIAEFGLKPAGTWSDMKKSLGDSLKPALRVVEERGLALLPTGSMGLPTKGWLDVSPHPYIVVIQEALKETAVRFPACGLQTHVDLGAYGFSLPFGLRVNNKANDLFTTMLFALMTASPFNEGSKNGVLDYRELGRRNLSTVGGVVGNVPIDVDNFLRQGEDALKAGRVPVLERGIRILGQPGDGSHKDTRVKIMGTMEWGPGDNNLHPWSVLAQAVLQRRFVEAMARGEELPAFMQGVPYFRRIENRNKVIKYGSQARLWTRRGRLSVGDAWRNFLEWGKPQKGEPLNDGWDEAVEVVENLLTEPPLYTNRDYVADYYDPRQSAYYLKGNPAKLMLATANRYAEDGGKFEVAIARTNMDVAIAYGSYMGQNL